jgi:cobalamin synthase
LAASITTVATTLPTEAQLPITAAQSTAATPFPATVTALPASATTAIAPATTRSNFVNALIVATDPATAAAIAAYHLVDGIFDTGKGIIQGLSPAAFGYSEILPIAKIRPVQLDIYA